MCGHPAREEIGPRQTEVERGRLLEKRIWFCRDCGEKWWTKKKIGNVEGITLQIDMA